MSRHRVYLTIAWALLAGFTLGRGRTAEAIILVIVMAVNLVAAHAVYHDKTRARRSP